MDQIQIKNLKLDVFNNLYDKYSFGYARLSANLIHFFGIYEPNMWLDSSVNYLIQKIVTSDELKDESIIELIINKHGSTIQRHIENANIVYSYCIGSYRILPAVLLALGYNVSLLVAESIYKNQIKFYNTISRKINKRFNNNAKAIIFSVSDKNVIFRLKKEISQENKVFIYFDGNTGTKNYNASNVLNYNFLKQEVSLHTGLAYLELLTHSTIKGISLLKSNITNEYTLKYFNHVSAIQTKETDMNKFCKIRTGEIMTNLENLLPQYYNQWDTITSIHKWLNGRKPNTENFEKGEAIFFAKENSIKFNKYRYFPFKLGGKHFIMDRKELVSYPISLSEYHGYIQYFTNV